MALRFDRASEFLVGQDPDDANFRKFVVPSPLARSCCEDGDLAVFADIFDGWEHVSVSTQHHCPNWDEMAFIKDMFWQPDDCVVQYHPPRPEYVNSHRFCLHMWRPVSGSVPRPPRKLAGALFAPDVIDAFRTWAGLDDWYGGYNGDTGEVLTWQDCPCRDEGWLQRE